jgi:ribosomal protein S26
MSVSEFTCIALGMLFNVLTFALGCAVGVSMVRTRKDSDNDDRNRYKNEGFQYYRDSKN